jgi:hypothetical protein
MLKLYTDTSFVNETYRRQLFPLLFDLCILENKEIKKLFNLVDNPTEADVFVFPIHFNAFSKHKEALANFEVLITEYNRPVWVYTSGDFGYTFNTDYYNFRFGGFNSKLNSNTFVLPAFINDPYKKLNQDFFTLNKTEKPEIGFVGHAKSGLIKYLKELNVHLKTRLKQIIKNDKSDSQSFYPSGYKRAKYLGLLNKSYKITPNFIFRNNYRAGITTEEEKQKTTLEFYNNMSQNAYAFCIRGAGNFSVRFYEALAMGRIPVLINTDCKLPLENTIDWNKHLVLINEKYISEIEDKITQFHNNLSHQEFIDLQVNNRSLWTNQLERVAYFKTIYHQFKS